MGAGRFWSACFVAKSASACCPSSLPWWMLAYRFLPTLHADRRTATGRGVGHGLSLWSASSPRRRFRMRCSTCSSFRRCSASHDFFCAERDGKADASSALLHHAMLGPYFLTKGLVAVFFPGRERPVLRPRRRLGLAEGHFFWLGWLVFLAIVAPWHGGFPRSGDAFFRGLSPATTSIATRTLSRPRR